VSVVIATLPTLAGLFPLWLAVTLHEGSTLLVALNSLRLLVDAPGAGAAPGPARRTVAAAPAAKGQALKVAAAARSGSLDPSEAGDLRSSSSSDASSSGDEDLSPRRGGASTSGSSSSVASEEEGLAGGGGPGLVRAPSGSSVAAQAAAPRRRLRAGAAKAARLFGGARGARAGCHEHRHTDCGACTPFTAAPCGKKGTSCSHCGKKV
jgi:hypothetical protein